jgi:hypothetical protein
VQVGTKRYQSPDRERELAELRTLIADEIDAGFYNIDIDTSTLVDLGRRTLADQQALNASVAADFTAFIREREPRGVTISVGGEIGEVGGRNSTVAELRAFMDGYTSALRARGREFAGVSKISVQTGTAHGGFVNPDGTVRMDVSIDLGTLEALSRAARAEYGLGGVVQHGASTLPPDAFDAFPRAGACEIHLATGFQTIVFEHPQFPRDLRDAIDAWLRTRAAADRGPGDTDEQFIYKARKKALGAFKSRMWTVDAARRGAIASALEAQFTMLMTRLNVAGTAALVARLVDAPPAAADRDREIAAAC